MSSPSHNHSDLLPNLFRLEYTRMTAVLCRHFGLRHIELAEDIASDAFLKAAEYWPVHGVPDQPAAWLYTVAANKARDYLKHAAVVEQHAARAEHHAAAAPQSADALSAADASYGAADPSFEFSEATITDSQLAMIFAVCHPAIPQSAQVCLALQVLCGFSMEEIAAAFLAKTETIKKRLQRARNQLRERGEALEKPRPAEVPPRLDAVLQTLYLLFNEGYFSKTHDRLIRKELCSEAVRLAVLLTGYPPADTPKTNALLALMCYQSSRLDARTDPEGNAVFFDDQDRGLWEQALIDKGNVYLVQAFTGEEASTYHLEAAIAYWHTTPDEHKWAHILSIYDQMPPSPMTALNRTFALAKVHGCEAAIGAARVLGLEDKSEYHQLLGYLYSEGDREMAIHHYKKAIALTKSRPEKQNLERRLLSLTTPRP